MKKLLLLAFAAALGLASTAGNSQTPDNLTTKTVQGIGIPNNSTGFEFFVAIPPNEAESYTYDPYVELYIASDEQTEVDMYYAGNKVETFKLLPFVVKVIKLDYRKCEIRKSETPLKQTYRFVSKDAPISIYELNGKSATSDGFMALPVNAWGTDYIHNSYWENGESKNSYFKSGFVVIANEDNTLVTVKLKSAQNVTYGKTDKGRIPGEQWSVSLNKGECYKVCTDAGTIGEFDISGTHVTSDKPIGFLSFHERATIPRLMASSRNHLVEMLSPTPTWGTSYVSVEFNRSAGGGDLFRIICKDPSTVWHAEWYDKFTGLKIGSQSGTLAESGDFVELLDSPQGRPNANYKSVNGTSRFWADKPIQVFQYSFSTNWDGSNDFDPFYITCTPVEQFSKETIFQVPANKDFSQNYLNLIIKGDTLDPNHNDYLLNSIEILTKNGVNIDTIKAITLNANLKKQRIPGTELFWFNTSLTGGAYTVQADTKFGGYVYGFLSVDGYGWPAVNMEHYIGREDYMPPIVNVTGKYGAYNVEVTDDRIEKKDTYTQFDYGISAKPRLGTTSKNVIIEYANGTWNPEITKNNVNFAVNVIDKKKDAKADLIVKDRAGNQTINNFDYYAPKMKVNDSTIVDYGKVHSKTPIKTTAVVKNIGEKPIVISYIKLNPAVKFQITAGGGAYNASKGTLAPGEYLNVEIQYTPNPENVKNSCKMIVTANDVEFDYYVTAQNAFTTIQVADYSAGQVEIGESKLSGQNIFITNAGEEALEVTGFSLRDPDKQFTLMGDASQIKFPILIAPKEKLILKDFIGFVPNKEGTFKAEVIFTSSGTLGDSIAVISGVGIKKVDVNDKEAVESNMTISPNPSVDGNFNVELTNTNANESANVEIMDESGVIVKTINGVAITSNKLNVHASELPSGNYFVKIKVGGFEYTSKIKIAK